MGTRDFSVRQAVAAAKVTIARPTPKHDLACFLAPGDTFSTGSSCTPAAGTPPTTFGYRSPDLQVTKNFVFAGNSSMYARLDLLNAFNYSNYSDYNLNWGHNGVPNAEPVTYNSIGNITGVPRTLKASLGMKF